MSKLRVLTWCVLMSSWVVASAAGRDCLLLRNRASRCCVCVPADQGGKGYEVDVVKPPIITDQPSDAPPGVVEPPPVDDQPPATGTTQQGDAAQPISRLAAYRTWTAKDGRVSREELLFVEIRPAAVVLIADNGEKWQLPLRAISEADLTSLTVSPTTPRHIRDRSGRVSTKLVLVERHLEATVVLETMQGKRIAVPLDSLSATDRQVVRTMNEIQLASAD